MEKANDHPMRGIRFPSYCGTRELVCPICANEVKGDIRFRHHLARHVKNQDITEEKRGKISQDMRIF